MRVVHYFDYKSPYAYLAQEGTRALERDFGIELEWLPYTLDIPSYLGSAEVDEEGRVIREDRSAHQWRRVRYAYMDARREAARRGLVIRGPRKIFDSSVAHVAMLFAKRAGDFRRYHDLTRLGEMFRSVAKRYKVVRERDYPASRRGGRAV